MKNKYLNFNKFLVKNKKAVIKKITSFQRQGRGKIHIILDFDRTLVRGKNQKGKNITVWDAIEQFVPRKKQLESIEKYKKYRAFELKQKLSVTQAIEWWGWNLDLFKDLKASRIEEASRLLQTRPFVREFFNICQGKNIPTIIISASIKNVIESWCRKEKIQPTMVLSTELFISNEEITGWKKDTLIHSLNKRERGHREIKKIKVARPKTILIGDSLDDVSMVEGKDNVIRIAIYDPNYSNDNSELNEFMKRFDLVFIGDNFRPIMEILDLF
jgi:HAD superfamily phosphoserine phosphatase-like hydrolase